MMVFQLFHSISNILYNGKISNKLYYDDKLGISGKLNFILKVRILHPDFIVKDITELLNNQTIN